MDTYELVAAVDSSARAMARAAEQAGLDAPVPPCPGWQVSDLLAHVGRLHRRVSTMVGARATQPLRIEDVPGPSDPDSVVSWLEDGAAELVEVLRAAGPDSPVWNWAGAPPTAAFWARRMAHETVVHSWDAARAASSQPAPVDTKLAADGIDEYLMVVLPASGGRIVSGVSGSLHVHCTDTDGEWLVDLHGDRAEVTRRHAKADAALRGPASDLLLTLYNRIEGGDVVGDRDLLAAWHQKVRFL